MARTRNSYELNVEPYLALVKSMRVDGSKEEDIAKHLGIGVSTWYKYKNEHMELVEVLKFSKEALISNLEKSLFQLAEGGFTTKKTTRKYVEVNGVIDKSVIEITEVIEEHKPNATSLIFSLKNLASGKWADKVDVSGNLEMKDFSSLLERFIEKI